MKIRKHILITGTGRAGTSFLMELCTNLGLETGFNKSDLERKNKSMGRAGLERDIRNNNTPYIIKSPWFCDYADEVFLRKDIVIEHIFVPIRNLNAASKSRVHVTKTGISGKPFWNRIKIKLGIENVNFAGGIWYTKRIDIKNQEYILLNQLYKLMLSVSSSSTNLTLIRYPLLINNPQYLYMKLKPILKEISYELFIKVFNESVQPELVNIFNDEDC